jgi:hypothetical protein
MMGKNSSGNLDANSFKEDLSIDITFSQRYLAAVPIGFICNHQNDKKCWPEFGSVGKVKKDRIVSTNCAQHCFHLIDVLKVTSEDSKPAMAVPSTVCFSSV